MTYCLYSVAIGIQKKGGEIVRVVFSVHAGRSVISAARVKRRCVESEHRTSVRSTETQVHTLRRFDAWFDRNRKFNSERSGH